MRFNPITADAAEQQAQSGDFTPWPPGLYDFTVEGATDETSSSGNEQIKLTLRAYHRDGRSRTVFDYLVNVEQMSWKIRHFAESIGALDDYAAGELDPRYLTGRSGRLKLRIRPARGEYQAQNVVQDYIPASTGGGPKPFKPPAPAPAAELDDDIPF